MRRRFGVRRVANGRDGDVLPGTGSREAALRKAAAMLLAMLVLSVSGCASTTGAPPTVADSPETASPMIASGSATASAAVGGSLDGVETYSNLSQQHQDGKQTYAQTPPVGGTHAAVWQNCGIYASPVANEAAVHSLEHGAVWITYRPDLAEEAVAQLQALARDRRYTLLSPYPELPAPVIASAWGVQLRVDSADDPRLVEFMNTYEQGPQTPEPGAPCQGGVDVYE